MPSKRDQDAEDFVLQVLQEYFSAVACERPGGICNDCILTLPHGGKIACEVKTDWKAAETQNLYFETRNTRLNTPSGLTATTADFWAQYVPHKQYILLTDPKALLWFFEVHKTDYDSPIHITRPDGGDGNSQGFKVKREYMETRTWVTLIDVSGRQQ